MSAATRLERSLHAGGHLVRGRVDDGWEPVAALCRGLRRGEDVGAALSVAHRVRVVAEIAGGLRDGPDRRVVVPTLAWHPARGAGALWDPPTHAAAVDPLGA